MKANLIQSIAIALAMTGSVTAQEKQPSDAEKAARAQSDAYVAAFNKADSKALAAKYAEDAEYTTDDGTVITGREAILKGLKEFFTKNKGAKLAVQIDSARLLTPDVLVEKGLATIGDETTRYLCSYVKKGNDWLISELTETVLPPVSAAEVALGELSWLVGKWKDNGSGPAVEASIDWTKNQHFLRRSTKVTREGEDPLEATEVIGYDPTNDQIRSWVFDSEGGFGEGTWKHEGDKWLITFVSTALDGTTSSAQHIVTYIDDKKFTWESINRQSEGEVLPNIDKIEVVRVAGQ
jgi:uncharacterized protein (TIGR02246 family)